MFVLIFCFLIHKIFYRSQAEKQTWTELEEEELKTLFMEHQQKNIEEGRYLNHVA